MSRLRKFALIGLIALNLGAVILLAMSNTSYRVDLMSVLEIWGDVTKDADRLGLTLTSIPIARELEIGNEVAERFGPTSMPQLQVYIREVGAHVAEGATRRGISYQFHILDRPDVNAFAVPGGHIFLTGGAVAFLESEAELAFLLAHEIAHVDLKHTVERLQYQLFASRIVGDDLGAIVGAAYRLAELGFSEIQEREADGTAILLIAQAGYSPFAAVELFSRIKLQSRREGPAMKAKGPETEMAEVIWGALKHYVATHPPPDERIREIEALIDRNRAKWDGRLFYVGRSNYQKRASRRSEQSPDELVKFPATGSEPSF